METRYEHRQRVPIWLILLLVGLGPFCFEGIVMEIGFEGGWPTIGLGAAIVLAALAISSTLTVRDCGDRLEVRSGPVTFAPGVVRYDEMEDVRPVQLRLRDFGLGSVLRIRKGRRWFLWGYDAVEITTPAGSVTIGSDDRDRLLRFLTSSTSAHARRL